MAVNAAALTAGLTMPVLTVKAAARDCFKVQTVGLLSG